MCRHIERRFEQAVEREVLCDGVSRKEGRQPEQGYVPALDSPRAGMRSTPVWRAALGDVVKSHMTTDLIPAIKAALSGQCFVSSFCARSQKTD